MKIYIFYANSLQSLLERKYYISADTMSIFKQKL